MISSTTLEEFEAVGVVALVRAGEAGKWFFGHFGAAMIAGARLLSNPNLPGPVALVLSAKLRDMLDANRDWYSPLTDPCTGLVGVEPVLVELRESAGNLRTSGHPTIYMTAALHVLSRQPALATERAIDALIALHKAARVDDPSRYYGHDDYFRVADRPAGQLVSPRIEEGSSRAMQAAFEALGHLAADQSIAGRHYFLAGEKVHLITHFHAIVTLEGLGYHDIAAAAEKAQESLRLLVEASNTIPPSDLKPARSTPNETRFWEQESVDPAHVIKLAEAVTAMLPRMAGTERKVAEENLARLWSLLGIC